MRSSGLAVPKPYYVAFGNYLFILISPLKQFYHL